MLLFHDLFTGKEILTDAFPMKLIDDFVYEVDAKYTTKSGDVISDDMIGGNPSAEEQGDDLDESQSKTGFDVILNGELEEYVEEPSTKDFLKLLKGILKAAKDKIPEDRFESVFKPKMSEFFKTGPGKSRFKNFQFYFSNDYMAVVQDKDGNETAEVRACPVLLDADDTGMKAKVYFFKDLMVEEKM